MGLELLWNACLYIGVLRIVRMYAARNSCNAAAREAHTAKAPLHCCSPVPSSTDLLGAKHQRITAPQHQLQLKLNRYATTGPGLLPYPTEAVAETSAHVTGPGASSAMDMNGPQMTTVIDN